MPDDASPPGEQPLPAALVLCGAVLLTFLLSLWAGFLVPVRLGTVPVPLWLLPLTAMLVLAAAAARRVGLPGALVPALVWVAVSWLALGTTRAEGDLVVSGSLSGYAYLFGGILLWAAVVLRASAAERAAVRPPAAPPPSRAVATPGRRTGR